MLHTMKNKYIIRSRILREEISFNFILCFYFAYAFSFARSLYIESSKISKITNISEVTLWRIFKQIRILIAKECEKTSKMQGEIEIDESYFLLRYTCNCKQKVLKELGVKEVGEQVRKHLYLVC